MGISLAQCSVEHWTLLCAARSHRFGEASHPGPGEFCLGTFNPTGLAAKHSVIAHLAPGVYSVTETHLSSRGIHDFKLGLKLGGSGFTLHHGHPVPLRQGSAVAGQYSGVGFVSTVPGRASPHAWPPELYQTSRLSVANFLIGDFWVLGGVAYGFATDKARTLPILDALLDRVLAQRTGPRFVSGDWNLEPHQFPQFERLRQNGFIDAQDLRYARLGVSPEATCKRSTRKDFLFISPELQAMFQSVSVDGTYWADHAALLASFRYAGHDVPRFLWRMPARRPAAPDRPPLASAPAPAHASPTAQYAAICSAYEVSLSAAEQLAGKPPLAKSECGRGRHQDVRCVRTATAPVRSARHGEHAPLYFGQNLRYGQWMRQLRRLQSLACSLRNASITLQAVEQRGDLWQAVLRAPGFPGSFSAWWPCRRVVLAGDPGAVPLALPSLLIAEALLLSFEANFRDFERALLHVRRATARQRRIDDPALIFRDFKKPLSAPVETLLDARGAQVVEVCDTDMSVTLADDVDWDPDAPFHCETAPLHVVHVECDKLWVSDLDTAAVGKTVSQVRHVGSLIEVFSEFGQQWGARWMRHADADTVQWQQVLADLEGRIQFPELDLSPITIQVWRTAVRSKRARSAPGPDGISRDDLLCMPDSLVLQVLHLCAVAEQTGSWPLQMLEGIVSSLEKTPQASRVSDFRPICVLSFVYRVWSSIRAKEALLHFAKHAPPGMYGTLPGCNSADVWMSLQLAIESSHRSGSPLYGISADLTKAFNMLPRLPIFGLARVCGLPESLVRPWVAAVTGLRRRFRVRGSVGPAILSNCGYPEGDPLSCVAMCIANTAFHLHMSLARNPSRTLSFVDNYETTSGTYEGIVEAHELLMEFSRKWDMPVDTAKTTAWCTSAAGRARLRAAGFNVLLDFRDLGAHLQTSRRFSNRTQVDRIRALDERWPMLAASHAPVSQKVRALSTAAWPAALHAIAVTPIGDCHISGLRAKALKGLNLKAPGANPMLQLSLVEYPVADPFFFSLRASFFDIKCLAGADVVAPLLAAAVHKVAREPGPATLLLQRANRVGVSWHPETLKFVDAYGPFDLWRTSCAEVQLRICLAWQTQVQDQMRHRPTFSGLEDTDPAMTRRVFSTFSQYEQAFLRISLNGTFFTNDALCHCGADESRACKFCGQDDSLHHRLFLCPHFAECRQEAGVSLEFLRELSPAQSLHAWVGACPSLFAARRELANVDGFFHDFQAVPAEECLDLFTDGSCLKPQEPNLRLATWAVVHGPLDMEASSVLISAGLVPGMLQSPYRGELCAVVSALRFAWTFRRHVRIWTDCQALLKRFRKWQDGQWHPSQRSPHWDLWSEVSDFFADLCQQVSFHKVVAHVDLHGELSVADAWCAAHNAAVDSAAKHAQALRSPAFWETWQRLCSETTRAYSVGRQIMQLHVLVARRSVLTQPVVQPVISPVPAPTAAVASRLGSLPEPSLLVLARRYGRPYIARLQRWGHMLDSGPSTLRWISTLQLYILFCLTWAEQPPILHAGTWRQVSEIPNGRYIEVPLAQRVKWFQQTLRQFVRRSDGQWISKELRPDSTALQARLTCVAVQLPESMWLDVETFLARNLPDGAVRSHQRTWKALPTPRGLLT